MNRYFQTIMLMAGILCGCAAGGDGALSDSDNPAGRDTYIRLKAVLAQSGETLDYDAVMDIHRTLHNADGPVPQRDDIIRSLMAKRNPNPRVDNIILIVAAQAIGDSPHPINRVEALFQTLLDQDHRLNLWVLAYISDALAKYPVDLPHGDQLADVLEQKVAGFHARSRSETEFFGYHFLPPPKGDLIRRYLEEIKDTQKRVAERISYYTLVGNGLTEDAIATAFRRLDTQARKEGRDGIDRPLKYLLQHWNDFFETTPQITPKPEGL